MIHGKATAEEIRNATNSELICCLVGMNSGNAVYAYEYKTAERIAKELERRGVVIADDLISEYKIRTSY